MLVQMGQFTVEPVMAARAKPLCSVLAITVLGAEVQLDRQFQMMDSVAIAQQQVQFAQCMTFVADRQVRGDQLDARGVLYGELPQPFVIQAQASRAPLGQAVQQRVAVTVQLPQPVFQSMGILHPVTAGQGVALGPGGVDEHRRGKYRPRQIAHFGMVQAAGQVQQFRKQDHVASIAVAAKA